MDVNHEFPHFDETMHSLLAELGMVLGMPYSADLGSCIITRLDTLGEYQALVHQIAMRLFHTNRLTHEYTESFECQEFLNYRYQRCMEVAGGPPMSPETWYKRVLRNVIAEQHTAIDCVSGVRFLSPDHPWRYSRDRIACFWDTLANGWYSTFVCNRVPLFEQGGVRNYYFMGCRDGEFLPLYSEDELFDHQVALLEYRETHKDEVCEVKRV